MSRKMIHMSDLITKGRKAGLHDSQSLNLDLVSLHVLCSIDGQI